MFVDKETGIVDIQRLRTKDLPFNSHVTMPQALKMEDEVKIFQLKTEVHKIAREMAEQTKMWCNLDKEERDGLKSLTKRVKDKEIVCMVTDKSGRWSCDTLDNYKESCSKMVSDESKTPIISVEEHEAAEREMNSHALAL